MDAQVVFLTATLLLYTDPGKTYMKASKLNPRYPQCSLMAKEFARSVRGVLIATAWEAAAYSLYAAGTLPGPACPVILVADSAGEVGIGALVLLVVLAYIWGDAHFYWSHRLLHTPLLYRTVHKVHHQSFNPDPLSGLSMHWLESM